MSDSTRSVFTDEIRDLEQSILKMGSAVEQMLHKSIEALTTRNTALAEEAIALDDVVDDYNMSIENQCLKLLALQQPMARDLRTIAAALKIITDIERVGDYLVDIAKTAIELSERPLFKTLEHIPRMSEIVKRMLRETLEAFVNRDLDFIQKTIELDEEVDYLTKSVLSDMEEYMQKDPSVIKQAVSLILIARYLERIADHLTNVGERVYYMETGELKELHT